SVARGYWGQPALAAQVFEATLAGEPDRRYLRTGDLGFVADGELFVTGRIKDLLILRGRNVYPQDVELTVEQADPAIRFGGCAAFGIEVNGEERLAIAAETDLRRGSDDAAVQRVAQRVIEAVRYAVADQHSVEAHAVVLVAARSIPKTSSGKLQRRACRAAYLANKLDAIASSVASAKAEEIIAGIWAEVLGQPQIGADDDFFDLGGHSLLATQVVARVRSTLGVELPLRALFEDASVTRFARRIAAVRAGDADGEPGGALDAIEAAPPLRPCPAGTVDQLSFAQQRLWFLDQLTPGSAAYNISSAVRMRGPLDVDALERSFVEIVRRHAAVRTRIVTVDGEPRPVVVEDPTFALAVTEATNEAEIAQLAIAEARRPFELSAGEPLLRARLVRLAADHHVLLLTMHHIASDGWSLGVLVRDAAALYAAFTRGQPSPLPPLAVQYADYAAWQRGWLDGPVLERQLAYWRRQLADAPVALDLPTDHPRTAIPAHRGAQLPVALPPAVVAPLIALARREGATLYMALLAAFHALLARYTGQTDILVGSPIAGRRRLELEGLIGFFVNTLVMRGDVSGAPSFRALLGRTRRVALDAYAHQDVPFEKLVEDLAPARDLGRTPLFQVMFILQNAPLPALDLAGVALEPVILDTGTAKFELTLSLESAPDGGLRGFLEYDADLFDAATARRLVTHYAALVQAVGAAPDLPLPEVSLPSADERAQLLALAGDAATTPPATTLHALFDAQVARTPDAPALLTDDGELSYTQLAHRANRLAHQLRELGVGPETRVGLYLRRSVDYVTAALAVLKAGGAYVPLDPAYPPARIQYMMSAATVELVVATAAPPGASRWLDVADPAIAAQPTHAPPITTGLDNVAYVVFTSGSTGDPNGVAGLHRGMLQRFAWMWERYPFVAGEVSALKTSPNFGDSVWETFGPLLQGVPSRVVSDDTARDPAALVDVLAAARVTRMVVVPSLLRALLEQPALDRRLPASAVWTSSGEALPLELVEQFRARLPGRVLLNLYGSSEASADSTAIDATAETHAATPTIGRPITGTRVYVLDDQLQPVPIGIPGQLYVAGEGLARGYLQQPALTAARFMPDPWAPSPGARMYCTGDLARVRDDGTLDYLGRRDRQIKIRGMRTDPGEVEAVLRRLELVKDAAVAVRDQRLIGYVVLAAGAAVAGVRERLRERLPEHMIPSALVPLAALPLTPSGKVDRRALPEPAFERVIERRPSPGLEEIIAGIWAEVLGQPQIGADDSFFDLGGHSLLATQVVARVRSALGVELPLRALFEDASVTRFARRIAAAGALNPTHDSIDSAPALQPRPAGTIDRLSFAQQRLWFLDQLTPGSAAYNISGAVRMRGPLDVGALEHSFVEIVRRHAALRTRIVTVDGE
ncbi:MAG TPA: amino acid adenylation domain-containing protein, partial [Kofleriaceae bacterium]